MGHSGPELQLKVASDNDTTTAQSLVLMLLNNAATVMGERTSLASVGSGAFLRRYPHYPPAQLVRAALEKAPHDLVGCMDGGVTDRATNPKYMEGFGQWRR